MLTAALTLPLALASPAYATTHLEGSDSGPGISVGEAIAIFAGIPIAAFLVISGLVVLLTSSRPSYRPGVAWTATPVWFNGPAGDADAAVAAAKPSPVGGATSAQW